jgi:AAA domain
MLRRYCQTTIQIISVKERLEKGDATQPEAIVSGLLFRKSMAVIGAPDDSFKTNFALQLIVSLAAGKPCYSYSLTKCNIVYLVLEGGEDYILERIEEKVSALGLNRDEVLGKISVFDASQKRLDDDNISQGIEASLSALTPRPDVIVFDPITYAMEEDVRFSPQKSKLCKNLLRIANNLNCVVLPIIHCRKSTQDNDNMDDFLGTSIVTDMAATRIKLFRADENTVKVYVKTRYAERPDALTLTWKQPLLEVAPEVLQPRTECKRKLIEWLRNDGEDMKMTDLVTKVAELTKHNPKTVRIALGNLSFERQVQIYPLPKSAIKMVHLIEKEEVIHAS